jgi:hypothetical protein
MLAWHFLRDDRRLQFSPHRLVKVGQKLTFKRKPIPCHAGLHASVKLSDALKYAPGPILCRVKLGGMIVPHNDDKVAAQERTCLGMVDASRLLHELALKCAYKALALAKDKDQKIRKLLRAKRLWLDGLITAKDLDNIRDTSPWISKYHIQCCHYASDTDRILSMVRNCMNYLAVMNGGKEARDILHRWLEKCVLREMELEVRRDKAKV